MTMTDKEAALEIALKIVALSAGSADNGRLIQALNVACARLEEPAPQGDAVSRDEVLEYLDHRLQFYATQGYYSRADVLERAKDDINALPGILTVVEVGRRLEALDTVRLVLTRWRKREWIIGPPHVQAPTLPEALAALLAEVEG